MRKLRSLLLLISLSALALGCGRPAPLPPDASASTADLAKSLPPDVSMSTPLLLGNGKTVAEKLKDLGAYAKDGKLYDSSDREIYFLQGIFGGPVPSPKREAEQVARMKELNEKYTVIDVRIPGV